MTTLETIKSDRVKAESKLAALREQRGAAMVDGENFDDAEITHLQNMVASLSDAEGTMSRRRRATETKTIDAARTALIGELDKLQGLYLATVERAEKGARGLVASLSDCERLAAQMRDTCVRAQLKVPTQIDAGEIKSRMSHLLTAVLKNMDGYAGQYGSIKLLNTPRDGTENWRECEARAIEPSTKLVMGKLNNGQQISDN